MTKAKDPYKIDRSFLASPFRHLYQDNDAEISQASHIQEIIEVAENLDSQIEGDFDLNYLVFQVLDYRFGFVKIGLLAAKIKFLRLYKDVSSSFHRFCQEYFHRGADYLNLLIQAADTVMELIHQGFTVLPQNEMQCRSLRKAAQKAGCEIAEAWQWVLDKIPPHKITHKTITDNILGAEPEEPPTLIKVVLPIALVETILRRALEAEMGFTEFLEEMFQPVKNADNLSEKLRQSRWEEEEEKNQDYYEMKMNSG